MAEITPTIEQLEREFAYLARRLEANTRLRKYPLDRAHYLLLLKLAEGPQSIGTLASALDLDSSTVTRQIAAMQQRGYVKKSLNPTDRRETLVARTRAGTKAVETMRAERRQRIATIFADWSEADRTIFTALLARANAALDGAAKSDGPKRRG